MKEKALVVGAGIGGLCTSLRLLKRGYNVEIIEKSKTPGGKVNLIESQGFKFDLTASILMNFEILEEFFNDLGLNIYDHLETLELDPLYRCFYHDGEIIDFGKSINENITRIEEISEEDRIGYLKFLSFCYEKYVYANKNILSKRFEDAGDFFNGENLKNLLKLNPLMSSEHYMKKFIRDQRLLDFLCFQALYIGVSPFKGSNVYTMIPTSTQVFGLRFIKGGMYKLVQVLEELVVKMGGDIKYGREVCEIVHEEKKVVGVRVEKEYIPADMVICNGEYSYAIDTLIKGECNKKEAEKIKYSPSVFMIYLGLDKRYDILKVHNHFFPKDFKKSVKELFKGEISSDGGIYVYCPSRIDGYIEDTEKECVSIMLRVPNLEQNQIEWDDDFIKVLERGIFDRLKKVRGLEDIEEHIVFREYLTPKYLQREFNAWKGSAFSVSHDVNQMMCFRPHIRNREYENLYFCGGSTHPGTGVTLVVMNSKIVQEVIMHDRENNG